MCRRVSESANAQGAGWGRELEAIGLREKVCFVYFLKVSTGGAQRMLGGS